MKHIILLGKPGSGKGTISTKLVNEQGYFILSGSNLLRENSKDESAKYYSEAIAALNTGILVSDDIINGMVKEKLKNIESKPQNIIFDGYPRTINQTEFLLALFKDKNDIEAIHLHIDDQQIKYRIIHRLTCKNCSASFNELFAKPKKELTCDHCQGLLYKRKDDNEDTLKVRLEQFDTHTQPIIDMLKNEIKFTKIDII